jgi:hypothetical protein
LKSSTLCNSVPGQSENKIYGQLFTQQFSPKSDLTLCNKNKKGQQHIIQKSEDNILGASEDRPYYNAKFFTQYPLKITKDNIEAFLNSEYFNVDEFVQKRSLKSSDNEASISIDEQINNMVHDIYQNMRSGKYDSKNIRIDAYRKKYCSNWSKPYESKMIEDFKRRIGRWDYNKYDMHHVTLNVDHNRYNSFDAESKISRNLTDLINDIKRGKKSVVIIDWFAIKEWDLSAPYRSNEI